MRRPRRVRRRSRVCNILAREQVGGIFSVDLHKQFVIHLPFRFFLPPLDRHLTNFFFLLLLVTKKEEERTRNVFSSFCSGFTCDDKPRNDAAITGFNVVGNFAVSDVRGCSYCQRSGVGVTQCSSVLNDELFEKRGYKYVSTLMLSAFR